MRQNLDLTTEQLRGFVLKALAGLQVGQMADLFEIVAGHAAIARGDTATQTGHIGPRYTATGFMRGERELSQADKGRVQDLFWDMVIEGIIRPGLGDGVNNNLPHFHVTEWGKQVLADGQASPHDPDGYLASIKNIAPTIDATILVYLTEALQTFRIGCLLASTVALGCASEKALLLLIDAYGARLPEPRQEKFRKDVDGRMIKRQFDEFARHLESAIKPKLPGDLKDDLDVHLSGIFSMIRRMRNDAGHPTGTTIKRPEANANLTVFPVYLTHVYKLMDWLKTITF